jgi:4-amino-4-deoxy-L-arabinose transferase-like glycosyltransferase
MTAPGTTAPPGPPRGNAKVRAAVALLLALHALVALWSTAHRSTTSDEIYHVTGGYLFDTQHDFRLHPENGVLIQRLQALPAVVLGAHPPPLAGSEYWRTADLLVVSHQFFYESGNDHWPLLMGARGVTLLFSLGLCALVFAWARALGGALAGLVALALAALSPTLLAHGALATSDVPAAFALTASAGLMGWQLQRGGAGRALVSGVVFGIACVIKYSAALLIPVFLVLALVHWLHAGRKKAAARQIAASIALHAAAALAVIWATFEFRFSAFGPGAEPGAQFVRDWDYMLGLARSQTELIRWLRDHRLLPEGFLFGYLHTLIGAQSRGAFLAGDYSVTGWPSFFPLAFLWKSTPAELAALAGAIGLAGLRWRGVRAWARRLAPLLALTAIYGAVAITSHMNIGHRHLTPMYPALFIVAGVAVARLRARAARLAAAGLVLAQAGSAAAAFPYYIPYFNAFAGGPRHGWRLLVDSSVDWGQEMGGLKNWLDAHNAGPAAQPVYLSYFGSADANYYGLRATRIYSLDAGHFAVPWYEMRAGLYCIGATMLQNPYSPLPGPWTLEREEEYQRWRRFEPQFRQYHREPAAKPALLAAFPAEQWERAWHRYELLRFERLRRYLRAREPDAQIGYAMFVFRLSEAEIDAAVNSSFSDWQRAIAIAASRAQPR